MNAEQVAAAIQAAVGGIPQAVENAVQQVMQANAVPAGPFACSPALAHVNTIDYSTSAGAKIFSKATEPLLTQFSLNKPNIRVLLDELQTRSNTFGWSNVLNVNVGDPAIPEHRNLLSDHGRIALEQCRAHSATCINAQARNAQNNYQLFVCLSGTVDEESKKKMANKKAQFTIGHGVNAVTCGATYLKLLLSKAEVDTRATASHIRKNLANLPDCVKLKAKDNIEVFNECVRDQINSLSSRGEETADLLTNLFQGYLACSDKKFVDYIDKLKDDYEEGADIHYELLMTKAQQKCKSRLLTNEWNAPTEEQEEIIALRAEIKEIKAQKNKGNKPKPRQDNSTKGTQPDDKNKKKPKKRPGQKPDFKGRWSWRGVVPKTGESWKKDFEGKTWHCCKCHGHWVQHTHQECEKEKKRKAQEEKRDNADDVTASVAAVGIDDVTDDEE